MVVNEKCLYNIEIYIDETNQSFYIFRINGKVFTSIHEENTHDILDITANGEVLPQDIPICPKSFKERVGISIEKIIQVINDYDYK